MEERAVYRSIRVIHAIRVDVQEKNNSEFKYTVGSSRHKGNVLRSIEVDYDYFERYRVLFVRLFFGEEGQPNREVMSFNVKYVKQFIYDL